MLARVADLHPDKKPFRILRKWTQEIDGKPVRHVEYEADFWEGGHEIGSPQGYYTVKLTADALFVRHTVSPSVSFWPQLERALND